MASTITIQRTIQRAQQMGRLSPLLFSAIGSVAIGSAPGIGYTPGDVVTISGGQGGTAEVTSITGGLGTGPVGGLILRSGGRGYFAALTNATTTGGTGTGLTVNTTTSFNDPAFSSADWVKQIMLSPPFAWSWNRVGKGTPSAPAFATIAGQSDYVIALADFGWLEKAVGYDPNDGYKSFELSVELNKGVDAQTDQPTRISTQYYDGSGNVTFRIFPSPDNIYNVTLEYQKEAALFTSTASTWTPIPDYLSYLYNEGFDAKTFEYIGDPRYTPSMSMFLQDLVANSQGLNDSQKNLWLEDRLKVIRQTNLVAQGRG